MIHSAVECKKIGKIMIVRLMDVTEDLEKTARLCEDLNNLCEEITWDDEVAVVILTGSAKIGFKIGRDRVSSLPGDENGLGIPVPSLSEPIARITQPVLAAVDGEVFDESLELALACDLRIASDRSSFGLFQIQENFIPRDGGTQRLPRLVGRGKAMEMILTGQAIDAQEAYRIGLVNRVVPSDQLMATAMGMAQEMAEKGPIALRYTKEAVSHGIDLTLDQGLRLEADLYLLLHTTKDRTEGIKAFREKRKPEFEGK
jgi:enoyl-CoA hydratase/carnithine racemase